jgi:hypothetical protein
MLPGNDPPSSYTHEQISEINSHLIKILRANPWLSRFYAGYVHLCAANPSLLKILEKRSVIFSDPNSRAEKTKPETPKGSNPMPLNPNTPSCSHIKVNGIPCSSPALRGQVFCYFHQRMIRGVRTPPKSRVHPIALIENETSIQVSLMEVINALVRNTIDARRAQLILRALNIAQRNAPRAHFDLFKDQMVRQVPDYPAVEAPPRPAAAAVTQAGALARGRKAITIAPPQQGVPPKEVVPQAAPPKPAMVATPITVPAPAPATRATSKPPTSVKPPAPERRVARGRSG